jgi:glycosyltransferase involved in cell wall biosynthesis
MKIIIICPVSLETLGGIEKLVRQEAEFFHKSCFDVTVISISKNIQTKITTPYKYVKFTNIFNAFKFIKFNIKLQFPEKVHFHDPRGLLFLSLSNLFTKSHRILSLHGSIFHSSSSLFRKLYFKTLVFYVINKADEIIEPGFKMYEEAKNLNNNIKLALPITKSNSSINLSNRKKLLFLCHGRFSELKGQLKSIETLIQLRKISKLDIRLILSGSSEDNDYLNKVLEMTRGLNWISVYPNCKSEILKKFYCEANFFISNSRYEGFGITQVEAVQNGLYSFITPYEGSFKIFKNTVSYLKNDPIKDAQNILEILNLNDDVLVQKKELSLARLKKLEKNSWKEALNNLI